VLIRIVVKLIFGFLTQNIQISRRKLIAATLLNSGTLAWFFLLAYVYLTDIFKTLTMGDPYWSIYQIGQILFFGSAVFFSIVGSLIGGRFVRRRFLLVWMLLGIAVTGLLAVFRGIEFTIISSVLLGLSFGLGLPSSLAFVAECTAVEERARVSGVIILGTFIIAFGMIIVTRMLSFEILEAVLILVAVRAISLVGLACDSCEIRESNVEGEKVHLPSTAYREFAFYLFPWVMFCIAAGIAFNLIPSTPEYAEAISLGNGLRYAFIAIFGSLSGLVADRFGRRWPIILGLVMLGGSFTLLGIVFNPMSVLIYLMISGIAWGSLFVVFGTVPGDLSVAGWREKFYALGYILPLSAFFAFAAIPGWSIFSDYPPSSIALILSVVLYLCIIPILRAKETLTGQKIRERKMKEYVDKIGKLLEEESR
jgi:MFS family permease